MEVQVTQAEQHGTPVANDQADLTSQIQAISELLTSAWPAADVLPGSIDRLTHSISQCQV